jgi:alanine-glyoxylate transaminase/serine-glyoxylate transaminase/serine-pyruvate transaminase
MNGDDLVKTRKLMIPGPVGLTDEVTAALAAPVVAHYGDDWMPVFDETIALLRRVLQTANDVFMIPGSGSAATDAALGSLLGSGEKVLIASNGTFGLRMVAIAENYGHDVNHIPFPPDRPVDPDALRDHLEADPNIRLIGLVHHETSTGMLNPLREVAALAREYDVPILVDAIASIGGVSVPVDEWGLDVVVAVGNKCLAAPPGLGLVSVSERAWRLMSSQPRRNHGWYLNLETWREYRERWAGFHPYPTTLPTPTILGLRASLKRIVAGGLEEHYARHTRAAQKVREGMLALGFGLFLDDAYVCPMVTAFTLPGGVSQDGVVRFLLREHNIAIARGIGDLREDIIRVGHMGLATSDEYVDALLRGVQGFLTKG